MPSDMPDPRDHNLRAAALARIRELQARYNDLIPVAVLREGFPHRGHRVSFGSFYGGIVSSAEQDGPAALCVVTAAPKAVRPAPYEDDFDEVGQQFTYRFRDAQRSSLSAL